MDLICTKGAKCLAIAQFDFWQSLPVGHLLSFVGSANGNKWGQAGPLKGKCLLLIGTRSTTLAVNIANEAVAVILSYAFPAHTPTYLR